MLNSRDVGEAGIEEIGNGNVLTMCRCFSLLLFRITGSASLLLFLERNLNIYTVARLYPYLRSVDACIRRIRPRLRSLGQTGGPLPARNGCMGAFLHRRRLFRDRSALTALLAYLNLRFN